MEEKTPRQLLDEALRHNGISIDYLIKHGREGLEAVRTQRDGDGMIIDEQPDINARHKYFNSFLLLLQLIKDNSTSVQVVNISPEEKSLMDSYRRDLDNKKGVGTGG